QGQAATTPPRCRGGSRSVLSTGARHSAATEGQVMGAARGDELGGALGTGGQGARRPPPVRRHLRLVHRGFRDRGPIGSEEAAGGTNLKCSTSTRSALIPSVAA